jgi:hypothetical protein
MSVIWALAGAGTAQVVPTMPKGMTVRPIGGGVNVKPQEEKKKPPVKQYVTHLVLSESRVWGSADGKTLEGKLIAFEDSVAEAPANAAEPIAPSPPANPTVVRGGKARLLVKGKAFEIPLSRLVKADQDFIEQIRAGIAKRAARPNAP